ncbi:MAG: hypothetical protein A2Z17_04155 [Gammaproteobacteria bacterium RBG_16_66_13]|nr:MAG: hypothetical protein A2Z17_04155 [Gammaproteobacteria bacterium RBG_16_66_13]
MIEALAAGRPVVGIDSPGVSDTIVDGENGFVAEDDVAALAAKLGQIVMDDDLRRRMGEAASRSAEAYDIERTSPQVEARYRALIAKRPHPRQGRLDRLWNRLMDRAT